MRKILMLFIILVAVSAILFLFPFSEVSYLVRKEFLITFKTSGILGHRNKNNKLDGKVFLYKNGRIEKIVNETNGIKQGTSVEFYPDGKKRHQLYYKNGKAEGEAFAYFESGKLNFKTILKNGNKFGGEYWYLENGKIDSYSSYDINGKLFFSSDYNDSGKLIKKDGFIMSSFLYSLSNTGDSLVNLTRSIKYHNIRDLYFTVATPPNSVTKVIVIVDSIRYENLKVQNNTVKIPGVFKNTGIHKILFNVSLMDSSGKLIDGINPRCTICTE